MGAKASEITSLTIVYSTVYSGADKKTSKLRVTGLCEGNSPATGEFPSQMASNAENISIWWRRHALPVKWAWRVWVTQPIPGVLPLKFLKVISETTLSNV